jgi:formylglycine-generating enzyme required for sulfatase activity
LNHNIDEAEKQRLLNELDDITTDHERRAEIGNILEASGDPRHGVGLGDDGIPAIEWCYVDAQPGAMIKRGRFRAKKFPIKPFYIAKYMITNRQFEAFLDRDDGFLNTAWWDDGLPKGPLRVRSSTHTSYPRAHVSWYQAVGFCRWLNAKISPDALPEETRADRENWVVRLPWESEWQWAAQGGDEARTYPWGEWDDKPRANINVAYLRKPIAVGMYPHGKARCGVLDMAGNLFEWCMDTSTLLGLVDWRVRRGGAFDSYPQDVRCAARDSGAPHLEFAASGLRVVYAPKPDRN